MRSTVHLNHSTGQPPSVNPPSLLLLLLMLIANDVDQDDFPLISMHFHCIVILFYSSIQDCPIWFEWCWVSSFILNEDIGTKHLVKFTWFLSLSLLHFCSTGTQYQLQSNTLQELETSFRFFFYLKSEPETKNLSPCVKETECKTQSLDQEATRWLIQSHYLLTPTHHHQQRCACNQRWIIVCSSSRFMCLAISEEAQ